MLLAILLITTLQSSGHDVISQWSSYVLGERWDFTVHRGDAEKSPRWSEFLDDPPLPPRQAIQSAQSLLKRLVENADAWPLRAVRLEPMSTSNSWAYIVDFGEPPPRPDGGLTSKLGIVVLMNGVAIEPTHHPWPEKK